MDNVFSKTAGVRSFRFYVHWEKDLKYIWTSEGEGPKMFVLMGEGLREFPGADMQGLEKTGYLVSRLV